MQPNIFINKLKVDRLFLNIMVKYNMERERQPLCKTKENLLEILLYLLL